MALKTNIANPALQPTPTTNATYGALEKIGQMTVLLAKSYNPLNVFDYGYLGTGTIFDEIGIPFVGSTETPSTGTSAFSNADPKLLEYFYETWNKRTYKTTVSAKDARAVVLRSMAETELVEKLVASLTESEGAEDYPSMLAILTDEGFTTAHVAKEITTNTEDLLKEIRKTVKAFGFTNSDYYPTAVAAKGWKSRASKEDVYILIPTTVYEDINIDQLAKFFNLNVADLNAKIIEIDTTDDKIYILERGAIGMYSRLRDFRMGFNYTTGKDEAFLYVEKSYFWSALKKAAVIHYAPATTA